MALLDVSCRLRYSSGFVLDAAFTTDRPVTALFGPSGSGKSTLLALIAGLRRADQGWIRLADRPLFDSQQRFNLAPEARHVGFVPQDGLLFPHLSARDNLRFGWQRRRAGARTVTFDQVVAALELGPLLEQMPHTLSGGQKQHVAIGRAILCSPDLLLLDEPLASLDRELKNRVVEFLATGVLAAWGIPALFVTHDAAEVRRLAHWVVHLSEGKVVGSGEPETSAL